MILILKKGYISNIVTLRMKTTIPNGFKMYHNIHIRTSDIIYGDISRNLPTDNDKVYIKHEPDSLNFAFKKEPSK